MTDIRDRYRRSAVESSWTDALPKGCHLPQLFGLGRSFDDLLQLMDISEPDQDKICKERCHCDSCYTCACKWSVARDLQLEKKQLEKALAGDPYLLQWLGKAWLKQTEPLPESSATAPVSVSVLGLNIDQEKEIKNLKLQLKEALKKNAALPAAVEEISEKD